MRGYHVLHLFLQPSNDPQTILKSLVTSFVYLALQPANDPLMPDAQLLQLILHLLEGLKTILKRSSKAR